MQRLHITESENTPLIILDKDQSQFVISGRSLSESPNHFYKPAISWITNYANSPNPTTEIEFKFEYLNTDSAKCILDLLKPLEGDSGSKVIWYFHEEDEDMEEIGEELAELVNIPFEFRHQ